MTDEAATRDRRRRTNDLIYQHQAEALRPFFDSEVKLIRGDGTLVVGIDPTVDLFEAQFGDPDFVAYARETATVTIDRDGKRAAEAGTWTGSWRTASGETMKTGQYLAVWKKSQYGWVIESELYIALGGTR